MRKRLVLMSRGSGASQLKVLEALLWVTLSQVG